MPDIECVTPTNNLFHAHLNTQQLCDLERSWTRSEDRNRELLRSLGPSVCADLIKVGFYHSRAIYLTLIFI